MNRLEGKIAIVTGAARGLGRGIAERLAAEGAVVVVTDVNGEGAQQTATELGGSAVGLACDVSDYDSVEALVADGTGRADAPGRLDLFDRGAAGPDREEDVGVGVPAGGAPAPCADVPVMCANPGQCHWSTSLFPPECAFPGWEPSERGERDYWGPVVEARA